MFWFFGHEKDPMWDLSSQTRDGTRTPCNGRRSLNHWTTREVPVLLLIVELENSLNVPKWENR